MRNIVILILIILYWFFLGTILAYVSADTTLHELSLEGNYSFSITKNTTGLNITGEIGDVTPSVGSILGMTLRMFTLRIPKTIVPSALNFIINFINWLLLLILAIVVWRLILPTTG